MKLVILFGSYREPSNGRRLLNHLKQAAPEHGFDVSIADAKAIGLPIIDKKFEEFEEGKAPENMVNTAQMLKEADAYILISGEYNASVQPGLKNLIDHFRTEYADKPVGLATYSPGALGGARVSGDLRAMVANLGMISLPTVLGVGQIDKVIDEQGNLIGDNSKGLRRMSENFLKKLNWFSSALKAKRESD